jgi:hypothetical protein
MSSVSEPQDGQDCIWKRFAGVNSAHDNVGIMSGGQPKIFEKKTYTLLCWKYHTDYNNNLPNTVSFIPPITSTSGRLHSEFIRLLAKWHVRVSKQSCKQANHLILWGVRTTNFF